MRMRTLFVYVRFNKGTLLVSFKAQRFSLSKKKTLFCIGLQRAGNFPEILENFHGKFREFSATGNFGNFREFSFFYTK